MEVLPFEGGDDIASGRLEELEQQIDDKIAMAEATFVDVGRMLKQIRDERLYEKQFQTFEAYLRDRWGLARRRGYQLIEASGVVENVQNFTHSPPTNEAQAHELSRLPTEEQPGAWEEVRTLAGENGITAAVVKRIVRSRIAVREGRPAEAQTPTLTLKGCFSVIYADPPWRYDHSRVDAWANENHYPTMDLADIEAMGAQVKPISGLDAVLFLWATSAKLPEALRVIEAWGFTYKSSMVWIKHKNEAGMGYWFRVGHEFLLLATKPHATPPPPHSRFPSVLEAPKGKHSEKPPVVRQMIEAMLPGAHRLELFARGSAPEGWKFWGNEIEERVDEDTEGRSD